MTCVKFCSRGKVEVYFSQVLVRIADGPAYAVYDEAVIVQRQVAEAGHQHADEKKDLNANEMIAGMKPHHTLLLME